MNQELNILELRQLSGPELQDHLLAELASLFADIRDGIVKEDTFAGCIALGHSTLSPLNENQSKQIKEVLLGVSVAPDQPAKDSIPILRSLFRWIRAVWRSHDKNANTFEDNAKRNSFLLDQFGRVKSKATSPAAVDRNSQVENQGIQATDVEQFLAAQGEDYTWSLPYAWDIANRLADLKKSENDGDLALFFERRRRLNVRRSKTTLFEQSAQRYAGKISKLYCDEHGEIFDEKALEAFILELVTFLLDKSKQYWQTSPLLAIFDGLVAPIMRPLLYKHRTALIKSELIAGAGLISSRSAIEEKVEQVTKPTWNETSQRVVMGFIRKAFKAQLSLLFMDRYAPYNRDYSKSVHLDSATLTNVGLLVSNFGNPVHLSGVMELLQPTDPADDLAEYVADHFRSSGFIDH